MLSFVEMHSSANDQMVPAVSANTDSLRMLQTCRPPFLFLNRSCRQHYELVVMYGIVATGCNPSAIFWCILSFGKEYIKNVDIFIEY